ncbi:MAG: NAD(P)H-quinone dehydrogenase [Mobiluncus sp.]|uniref:NAD(P)H-quinone dehydrogenase n=1 Tax=Mobiluncus porci TaxID=2652278 RepID=A0A7K0K408_9ACTO|nr:MULTISPECIES: NAD(P)H-quinone dehydrogenase [Mobiluncus]MCI6583635.1 NAD(P)H-quinone dehydrogenase [Mobiluncus sp.]MST50217.1 NAD(P)H-quinone dehydrogenase [Mobiluncus porci]
MAKNEITVVIIGGGPGGYEAAAQARVHGARTILIEEQGPGGSAVLTDVIPSKTLIASSVWMDNVRRAGELNIIEEGSSYTADVLGIFQRVGRMAAAQSEEITHRLTEDGVEIIHGRGEVCPETGENGMRIVKVGERRFEANAVIIATGARPRKLDRAMPDGKRILTWKQIYSLKEVPEHLIVVGSGVTGAEFASAFNSVGVKVTLVSSRDRVLPNDDPDAARLIEEVFKKNGVNIFPNSRAEAARVEDDKVIVTLHDGREIEGSHVLMAVGAIPNTDKMGLEEAGVELDERGFIKTDRVSRTTANRIYAAGDCTGVFLLASVASAQGRLAIAHALGDAVEPLELSQVSSNIFTNPEIAAVGVTQAQVDSGEVDCVSVILPIARNARARMRGIDEGFVKLFARRRTRTIAGAVICIQYAGEFIFPLTLAVKNRLTVDQFAGTFTIYPSISGTITEAARSLHKMVED